MVMVGSLVFNDYTLKELKYKDKEEEIGKSCQYKDVKKKNIFPLLGRVGLKGITK